LLITKYKERLEGDVEKITLTQSKKIIRNLSELISFVEMSVFLQSVNVFMTFIVNHSHECVPFRIFALLFLGFGETAYPSLPAKPTLTLITYHEVIKTTKVILLFTCSSIPKPSVYNYK